MIKTFTLSQLKADWCKVCVYKNECDTVDNRWCGDVLDESNENIGYLGKVLYGEDAVYVKE